MSIVYRLGVREEMQIQGTFFCLPKMYIFYSLEDPFIKVTLIWCNQNILKGTKKDHVERIM